MRILVVDDERSLAVVLGLRLRRLGHEPLLAHHPQDALEMLDGEIDAVITDIDMPDMNGVELATAIRNVDEAMPIAFCTGSDPEDEAVRQAATIGPVLAKSWSRDEVADLVDELGRIAQRLAVGSGIFETP